MPAPPARIRSEKVPCGTSSTSSSPREELPLELLVLADVGRDHLADLAGLQQQAEAEVVDAGVVADDGQVFACPARAARAIRFSGIAAQAEAADHDRRAVGNQRDRLLGASRALCS